MKRPSKDAWYEKQMAGPLVVYFTVRDMTKYGADADGEDAFHVDWSICPDDEDKATERAYAGSDGEIRGSKAQLDALIDRAMKEAREAAVNISIKILDWAQS